MLPLGILTLSKAAATIAARGRRERATSARSALISTPYRRAEGTLRQGKSRSPSPAVGSRTVVALPSGKASRWRTMRSASGGGVRTKADVAMFAKVPAGIEMLLSLGGWGEQHAKRRPVRHLFRGAGRTPSERGNCG